MKIQPVCLLRASLSVTRCRRSWLVAPVVAVAVLWTSKPHAGDFLEPTYGVSVTSDIVYGTGATSGGPLNLLLDFYEPIDIGTPVPATSPGILYIHGGSFIGGDKADTTATFMSHLYASHGYRVLSINYRLAGDLPPNDLGPPAQFAVELPQQIWPAVNAGYHDSLTAANYMLDNAASFDIDPSRWAIAGHSAGAGIALAEAYFDPPVSRSPAAVLSFMGGTAGAETAITAPLPPAFIVHDPADSVAPFHWSGNLSIKLTELGVHHEFWQPTNGHTLNQDTMVEAMPNGKTLLENNMIFLAEHLVPEPSTLTLAGLGLVGLFAYGWRRRRRP